MNQKAKKVYVTPTVEVMRIVVERSIAVHSPIPYIDMIEWEYEIPEDDPKNNADIWVNI